MIGPWEGPRPALVAGQARISVLIRGINFGQGPFELLSADLIGSRAIDAGTTLMRALIERSDPAGAPTGLRHEDGVVNMRPQETLRRLCSIFPSFADEWAGQGMPPEDGQVDNVHEQWTHHRVLMAFLDYFSANHEQCTHDQVKQLGAWLNAAVAVDGDLENAVSTCFLEHLHQVGIGSVMAPYLSERAKARSHA